MAAKEKRRKWENPQIGTDLNHGFTRMDDDAMEWWCGWGLLIYIIRL